MKPFTIKTRSRTDFVNIDRYVTEAVREAGLREGVVTVFVPHTTAGVTINENADPDVLAEMKRTYVIGKGTLLTVDDPEHKDYRDVVKDFFLVENIREYVPWITDLANILIDELPANGSYNFVEGFARPLPLSVIMHVIGMPLEIFDRAFQWTLDNVALLSQVADK